MKPALIALVSVLAASPAFATAIATITGFGTTEVEAFADAEYAPPCDFPPCNPPPPPTVSASVAAVGITFGPVRQGFLEVLTIDGGVNGLIGGGVSQDLASVDVYSFSCGILCGPPGIIQPFMLGVPFDIMASANASTAGFGSGAGIDLHFSLFEYNPGVPGITNPGPGNAVIVYDEATLPEPSTWLLCGLGLAGLYWRRMANPIAITG